MTKDKIVRVDIVDEEDFEERIQDSFYLVNPDREKLAELKSMIENRFEYLYDDTLSDKEREKAEKFCENVWDDINKFVDDNFEQIVVDELFEIDY